MYRPDQWSSGSGLDDLTMRDWRQGKEMIETCFEGLAHWEPVHFTDRALEETGRLINEKPRESLAGRYQLLSLPTLARIMLKGQKPGSQVGACSDDREGLGGVVLRIQGEAPTFKQWRAKRGGYSW